jgi:hypothetical protein
MYHTIEFTKAVVIDLEISRQQRLEKMLVRKGNRVHAQVRPYVAEMEEGPVEMADLFFDDGTSTSGVPFGCFSFVD